MIVTPVKVVFEDNLMWVSLSDGRVIGVPLTWFPSLVNAQAHDLNAFELSQRGIHWDSLDEDISVDGLLTLNYTTQYRP
ncbi:DUF2442 domain-containing protein [Pantoea ananatis]|uniref:DUF2442 domain-containing protein n=1 Tax=Pantoea ananas TaxID=553 RepID=UPI000FEC95BA|nr:DUF2442 domain-containing protein [Pantoea ananatis]MCW0352344.1 hypothetical protein [Pantoea ananatis]QAB29090.1 DUF2442 domain-containing protein [Pantoea ananatis]USL57927.1 DUF2442 domain-containing protein [Pantoea ananatis]